MIGTCTVRIPKRIYTLVEETDEFYILETQMVITEEMLKDVSVIGDVSIEDIR